MTPLPRPSAVRAAGNLIFVPLMIVFMFLMAPFMGLIFLVAVALFYGLTYGLSARARTIFGRDFIELQKAIGIYEEPLDFYDLGLKHTADLPMWDVPRVYTIKLPQNSGWNAAQAVTLVTKLVHLGNIILRIEATPQSITWQLIDVNEQPFGEDEVTRAIRAGYMDAEVSEPELLKKIEMKGSFWRRVDYYHQEQEWPRPSLRADNIKKADPLTAIVNSMVSLQEGEWVSYLVGFGVGDNGEELAALMYEGIDSITTSKVASVASSVFTAALAPGKWEEKLVAGAGTGFIETAWGSRPDKFAPEIMAACVEKIQDVPPIRCFVVVEANSPRVERLHQFNFYLSFVKTFATEFQTFTTTNEPETEIIADFEERKSNSLYELVRLLKRPMLPLDTRANVFMASEIAALWHLPHEGMTALEIGWVKGKQIAAPMEFRGEREGVLFGTNRQSRSPIYQPLSERVVHTLVFGKTGVGKTSFMQALAEQDIKAGNGVAVIDPLGGFVRRLLQHGIPKEREGDVVVLDIGFEFNENGVTVSYPPPLNPLIRLPNVNSKRSAGDFAAVLGKLYDDTSQTRWMQTLQAALQTLSLEEQPTLYDIWPVIEDADYRNRLLKQADFSERRTWEMLEKGGGLKDTSVASILWRLNEFLSYNLVRASTCNPQKLDMHSLIHDNKIILVSVHADESVLPQTAQNVLGSLILTQIQLAALGGAVADPKNKPFMLYVDEMHNFRTGSLDTIARQARQKGLGLVIGTQNVKSIAPTTLRALEGNIGTLVAFECSQEDAENALPLMPLFSVSDLMNMGRYRTAISMRSENGTSRASFSVDPVAAPDVSREQSAMDRELYLRHKSVVDQKFMTYDEVNSWLNTRYEKQRPHQAQDEENTNDFGNPITN